MARRTLSAHSLEFHLKRKKSETAAPSDLDGADLLDEFLRWCDGLGSQDLTDPERSLFVSITDIKKSGRIALVTTNVGTWGEPGPLIDHQDGTVVAQITEEQAPSSGTRAALYVPKRGGTAMFFIEYCDRGSGGGRLLRHFAAHWSDVSDFTMVRTAETEGEAWVEGAKLREVEVRVRVHSSDTSDPSKNVTAILHHTLKPTRNHWLDHGLFQTLKRHPERAAALVGLPDMPDDSEAMVTLADSSGRQKKFVLGERNGSPALRIMLNDHSEPTLDEGKFIKFCEERALELLSRTHLT